jgi:hypothetical protein
LPKKTNNAIHRICVRIFLSYNFFNTL